MFFFSVIGAIQMLYDDDDDDVHYVSIMMTTPPTSTRRQIKHVYSNKNFVQSNKNLTIPFYCDEKNCRRPGMDWRCKNGWAKNSAANTANHNRLEQHSIIKPHLYQHNYNIVSSNHIYIITTTTQHHQTTSISTQLQHSIIKPHLYQHNYNIASSNHIYINTTTT